MDSQTLRKRRREPGSLTDSIDVREPKCFHVGEETGQFLELLHLDQTLADDEEDKSAPSEELVNGLMRSLQEELTATCFTSSPGPNSEDKSAASDISSGHEGQTLNASSGFIDLCYLLEASDDDLGIPASPVLDLKVEVCLSTKETWEGLWESSDLKSVGENWHYEDDFDSYQEFKLLEDAWYASQLQDYMHSTDFVSQDMLFYGDFCDQAWRLETPGGM